VALSLKALEYLKGAAPAHEFNHTLVDVETNCLDKKFSRIVSIGAFKIAS
jgi:cyclopropane fatty-acyl-phospholipid synthase-like methyltransferase